jgi:hypothetical protein
MRIHTIQYINSINHGFFLYAKDCEMLIQQYRYNPTNEILTVIVIFGELTIKE